MNNDYLTIYSLTCVYLSIHICAGTISLLTELLPNLAVRDFNRGSYIFWVK